MSAADYFVLAAFSSKTEIMKTEISAASGASLCIIALGEVETNIGKIPLVVEASQYSQRNERISFGMFQTLLELQRKLN